jgi:hypothetical protein
VVEGASRRRGQSIRLFLGTALATLIAGTALAADPPPDKSGYTIFDPPPDDALRSLNSDRPGQGQSPNTVDAGHVQLEIGVLTDTFDRDNGVSTRLSQFGSYLIKLGITNDAEIEFGLTPYASQRVTDRTIGQTDIAHGIGDSSVAARFNLLGNDSGDVVIAILPALKLPTAAQGLGNNGVEFSLGLPINIMTPDGWVLAAQPGTGWFRDALDTGYHANFVGSASLKHPVFTDDFAVALELFGVISGDHAEPDYFTLDPSATWMVTPTVQLDLGVDIGLNRAAPDTMPYIGISFLF